MKRPPFASILCPTDLSATGDEAVALAFALVAPGGTVLFGVCLMDRLSGVETPSA